MKRVSEATDVASAAGGVDGPRSSSTPPPPRLTGYNTAGLPLRPSALPCSYFMRTGHCKYARNCVHHHPESAVPVAAVPSPACLPQGSLWQLLLEQQQSQATTRTPQSELAESLSNLIVEYPERVGQRDCDYYLKTGRCSFGATCRYNHPKDRQKAAQHFVCDELNNLGLPLREVCVRVVGLPSTLPLSLETSHSCKNSCPRNPPPRRGVSLCRHVGYDDVRMRSELSYQTHPCYMQLVVLGSCDEQLVWSWVRTRQPPASAGVRVREDAVRASQRCVF
jgi:hypothetical protein